MPPAFREEFSSGLHIQMGLAAGPVFSGHLGYAQFKAMVCGAWPDLLQPFSFGLICGICSFKKLSAQFTPGFKFAWRYFNAFEGVGQGCILVRKSNGFFNSFFTTFFFAVFFNSFNLFFLKEYLAYCLLLSWLIKGRLTFI